LLRNTTSTDISKLGDVDQFRLAMQAVGGKMFDVQDTWMPRMNPSMFKMFVEFYFPPMVSGMKGSYKRRLSSELISKILNPSDEAFVYLVIENNYDYWMEIYTE
jgi:hypothetical protein